jgi:hypothetical protein
MTADPRSYLLDRFRTDAETLRARAAQLAGKPAPTHGPDAAASHRMADACDHISALLEALPEDVAGQLEALEQITMQLKPLVERAPDPFVRSVYGGAATRIADIVTRERSADDAGDADDEELADEVIDDDLEVDDDEVDDDDLDANS